MDELAKLAAIPSMLAEANSVAEVKHIMDIAEAARTYAKKAKLNLEIQNNAAEASLRAQRRAGEILAALERDKGGRPETHTSLVRVSEYRTVLEEENIAPMTAYRWQTIANVPDPVFEQHIFERRAGDAELTSAGVLKLANELRRAAAHVEKDDAPPLPTGKYRVIYADPPWTYGEFGSTVDPSYGGTRWHYPSMTTDELCELPVPELAEADSVLFLWATSPKLPDAMRIVEAWGFDYKTSFVWDKVKHNFGYYNSVRHEFLLVAGRGRSTPDVKTLYDSVLSIERTEHSAKPEEFRNMIDALYPVGRRIELFARREANGWERWGNE